MNDAERVRVLHCTGDFDAKICDLPKIVVVAVAFSGTATGRSGRVVFGVFAVAILRFPESA